MKPYSYSHPFVKINFHLDNKQFFPPRQRKRKKTEPHPNPLLEKEDGKSPLSQEGDVGEVQIEKLSSKLSYMNLTKKTKDFFAKWKIRLYNSGERL